MGQPCEFQVKGGAHLEQRRAESLAARARRRERDVARGGEQRVGSGARPGPSRHAPKRARAALSFSTAVDRHP
jgi:hypothetical protein